MIKNLLLLITLSIGLNFNITAQRNNCDNNAGGQATVFATCTWQPWNVTNNTDYWDGAAGCGAGDFDDTWGYFQATSTSTTITYFPLGGTDAVLTLYAGIPCNATMASIACANAGGGGVAETIVWATTIGTNYRFRVQRVGSDVSMNGELCIYQTPVAGGHNLGTGDYNACTGTLFDTGGGGGPYSNNETIVETYCSDAGDCIELVFNSFDTESCCDDLIIYDGPNTGSPIIGTYNGTTSPGTITSSSGCLTFEWDSDFSNTGGGWDATISCLACPTCIDGIQNGQELAIDCGGPTCAPCACGVLPLANDDPCCATALTVNADLLCGVVTASTINGATNSSIAGCVGTADDDVWFSFVATSTVHDFDLLNLAGSTTNMVHEIFSGTCGALGSIACSDPNTSQWSGFTIGTTYFVRVYTNTATGGQTTTFDFCIGTPPPPPSNDEPCGAIVLAVNNGSCAYQSAVLGTSSTVSAGMPAPGCGSLGPDIWYQFTVPASGQIIVDMAINGGPADMDMAWYTSSTNDCNNLDGVIECDDADSQNGAMAMICRAGSNCLIPGNCAQNGTLTPGITVWVRLWEYGGSPFGPFDICAYDPGTPGAASTCANATVVPGLPYSNSAATTCCRANTYGTGLACASSYQAGEDFMYEYTPAANEILDITLTGTLTYTGLFVTDDCPNAGGVNCVASSTSTSGNPTLCGVALTAGTTYYIMVDTDPNPACTPFNLNMTSSSAPSCGLDYTASVIGFAPDLNAGTNIALPIDDRFSSSYVPIGFDFCFDGYEFTQLLVSSNGYVIFDPIGCSSNLPGGNAAPGGTSDWSISAAIPNTNDAPRNSILFPWHDVNPALGGTIRYQTLGVAPNRRFVITFNNVPYFSCNALLFTGQLKLFETTNNIEMHLADKVVCAGWNGGDAILGLHNYNGTIARLGVNYPTNWTASNEAILFTYNCPGPCITVLPVELINFDGVAHDDYNLLEWSTASEINNDYFLLERSDDGVTFETLETIDGNGNSEQLIKYSQQHLDPNELEYYRLKQVDFDGKFEYSNIIAVSSIKDISVNIYPNPATNNLFFNLSESKDNIYTIVYTSILGSVSKEQITITKGTDIYQVNDFGKLNSGIYFIQILDENNKVIKTQKIVKE